MSLNFEGEVIPFSGQEVIEMIEQMIANYRQGNYSKTVSSWEELQTLINRTTLMKPKGEVISKRDEITRFIEMDVGWKC